MKEAWTVDVGIILVSASPYTAHKEGCKNVQLSDEAVVAYLKNKMETENLVPAKIMEYVLANSQQKKPAADGDTNNNIEPKSKFTNRVTNSTCACA